MHTVDIASAWSKEAAPYSSCESTAAKPHTLFVIATTLILAGLVGALLVEHLSVAVPQRSTNHLGLPFDSGYPASAPWAGAIPTPFLIPSPYPPPSYGELPRSRPAIRQQPGPQWREPQQPGPRWRERLEPGASSSQE